MDGQLIVRGKIIGIKPSSFEGKTSMAVQMLRRNRKNAVELMNIKMPEGTPADAYQEGQDIEFEVDAVAVDRQLYFRFVRDLKADNRRAPSPSPTPAKTLA